MGVKAKEKYHLKDGSVVPGTTTITGELGWSKNSLVSWANKLGLRGIETRKFTDDKAMIGTLAHSFVLAEMKGEQPDTSDYTLNQINQAKNCLASYNEWKAKRKIEPIIVEQMLVSERHRYGGTPDFFGKVDEIFTLVDYKTGKGIYPEYTIQVAAYRNLLMELDHNVENVRILSIPRGEDESFSEKILFDRELEAGWEIFKNCLTIYNLKGAVNKNE